MDFQRWQQLMQALDLTADQDTFPALAAAYNEQHRFYHNQSHIFAVLKHLDKAVSLAEKPAEIELALWFHDAIYQPFSSSNELDSADWALRFLKQAGGDLAMQKHIHKLIMATAHTASPETNDEKLIVDIDLSILGTAEDIYWQFEANVRKEYKRVPGFIYKKKRKAILKGFLSRDRIYHHDYFYQRLENQARHNIKQAIASL